MIPPTRQTWFAIPSGHTHIQVFYDGDEERFPLGRAACAPFGRRPGDPDAMVGSIGPDDFCRRCLATLRAK